MKTPEEFSQQIAAFPAPLRELITAELKAKGYERATANQVADAFETLMNVPQDELADMVKDEKAPMSLRIVGKAMLTAKGWEVLQAMLDRAHGKAKQKTDITSDDKALTFQVILPDEHSSE